MNSFQDCLDVVISRLPKGDELLTNTCNKLQELVDLYCQLLEETIQEDEYLRKQTESE